jgi:hypothetical protein
MIRIWAVNDNLLRTEDRADTFADAGYPRSGTCRPHERFPQLW